MACVPVRSDVPFSGNLSRKYRIHKTQSAANALEVMFSCSTSQDADGRLSLVSHPNTEMIEGKGGDGQENGKAFEEGQGNAGGRPYHAVGRARHPRNHAT